ncbi:MAG: endonuclease MutS2 [Solobacterium sp.]|nr:endonuclease MutS2 [Solobacterium sp.]
MSLLSSFEFEKIRAQMAELCVSEPGRMIVNGLEPVYEKIVIRRDRQRLYEAMEACVRYGRISPEGFRDIRILLKQAEKGRTLTGPELIEVLKLIRAVKAAQEYERTIREVPHESLSDLFMTLTKQDRLENRIVSVVNEYGEVRDSASHKLAELRSSLRAASRRIEEAIEQFRSGHGDSMVDSIVTTRNGRTVILVRANDKNRFGGIVYGDSQSGQTSYIEPSVLMHANNRKQELETAIQDEISRILAECSAEVGKSAETLSSDLETLALLDSIFARADWGVRNEGCAARLNEEKRFMFHRARHPLIPKEQAVTNEYRLSQPYHTLLITGPNTGGKTVSMKIFGLFTLMTYCGMPVTAEEADVPFFDRVFADIGDDQSVESSLSSFSAHVEKQAQMLREATGNSLILLDEIGSGTDPREGESLAIAVLNELRRRNATVIATTHYSRLKAYGRRHEDILTATVEFDGETLRPTYRYLEGITGESNALLVAERCGLPKGVVNYAKFLKQQATTEEEELAAKLEKQLMEAENRSRMLEEKLKEIREYQKSLEQEKQNLRDSREKLIDEAKAEAQRMVEAAREEADAVLKELRNNAGRVRYHELLEQKRKLETIAEEETPVYEAEKPFAVGDTAELRQSGAIVKIEDIRKKRIVISLNNRHMTVKASDLKHTRKKLPKTAPVTMPVSSIEIPESIETECNLIGLRVDEAREELLDYMDSASLCGLKNYRIIHGDGSGALRKMVQEVLANDKTVEEYRYGMPSEGGTGATVVTIRD